MNMRRLILLIGGVALVIGVLGLLIPVSVSGSNNESIGCGNAVVANTSAAREAEDRSGGNIPVIGELIPHEDYVALCQSAVSQRRAWSIPVTVIGLIAVAGSFLVDRRSARPLAR